MSYILLDLNRESDCKNKNNISSREAVMLLEGLSNPDLLDENLDVQETAKLVLACFKEVASSAQDGWEIFFSLPTIPRL